MAQEMRQIHEVKRFVSYESASNWLEKLGFVRQGQYHWRHKRYPLTAIINEQPRVYRVTAIIDGRAPWDW